MKDKVLQFLIQKGEATPHEIADATGFSRQYVQRKLLDLLERREIIKIGKPPLVFYQILEKPTPTLEEIVNEEDRHFLKDQFIEITEDGRVLEGLEAFSYWCLKRKLPVLKTISEYRLTIQKYHQFIDNNGFINGTEKIRSTKDKLLKFLKKNNILCQYHYIPIYKFKLFNKKINLNFYKGAEFYYRNSLSLPIFYNLGLNYQKKIVRQIKLFLNKR